MSLDNKRIKLHTSKMTKKLRDRLSEVDDKDCVLFEFSNDENELKIGFSAWIQRKKSLTDWIDEEAMIYWPKNCSISPAKKMAKKLATADWEEHVVVIKAVGGELISRSISFYFSSCHFSLSPSIYAD